MFTKNDADADVELCSDSEYTIFTVLHLQTDMYSIPFNFIIYLRLFNIYFASCLNFDSTLRH